jgi:lipoprotein signal peptidase
VKEFLKFVLAQCLNYFLLVMNYRAVAQARFFWTLVTDTVIAAVSYWMIQKVSAAKSRAARAGYIAGGALGSMIGLAVSKLLYGQ